MASSESTAGPGVTSAPAAAPPRAHAITARRLLWWGDLGGAPPAQLPARLTWAALLAGGVAAAILVGQRARGDASAAARLR
ncbi:MAG: hypothetical protein H6709_24000 [Kofleriaceae bacterium]|nr:hypothetical protein [Kofleriaceae bacterium]